MPASRILTAASVLLLLPAMTLQDVASPDRSALTAAQILDEMAKVYSACKSYRDTGVVKSTIVPKEIAGVAHPDAKQAARILHSTKPFKTAFVRPSAFRFQFSEEGRGPESLYIVWWDGQSAKTWWGLKPTVQEQPSLMMGVAGATGVSGMSALTIPRLLLPEEIPTACLADLIGAERLADELLDGRSCFRIKGTLAAHVTTIWIDQESSLVRRIDHDAKTDSIIIHQTTTYAPERDVEIPPTELALGAPP